MNTQRIRLTIEGRVQGVGFRPYIYRLARALDLSGFVRNDRRGVVVEVQGPPTVVSRFVQRLPVETPLAECGRIVSEEIPLIGLVSFTIAESATKAEPEPKTPPGVLIAPDVTTCDDCLGDLFDPSDRRYRYPFVNCTNCGPRFTIIRGLPYDRSRTTMAGFVMCGHCQAEYDDPENRRFHAQPNACPVCGPRAVLCDPSGAAVARDGARDAIAAAAQACREGLIVAVKGVGGYHLACLARDERAVQHLRERKHRPDKPFAVMVADPGAAHRLVRLNIIEQALMSSRARPIVLARRRTDAAVAAAVAPRQRDLGVMLPSTPLHHLLLHDVGEALVMTSGNVSDEPLVYRDDDARRRLAGIADLFLTHDRPIETPADDSIVRVVSVDGCWRPLMLRRSRGHAPTPLHISTAAHEPTLACGGHLKNTYCLVRDHDAWVGPHVGDLEQDETFQSYTAGIARHERLLAVTPSHVAHDLHPEYLATKYALDRAANDEGLTTEGVQHHHAHLAACVAEHGERGPVVGVIFDGTGYGPDGTLWGGEILVGGLEEFERVGHLWPVRMPGGEAAIREPWRMACAWLAELSPYLAPVCPSTLRAVVEPAAWRMAAKLTRSGLASPSTTSAGRLLDAIAALCGICPRVSYEGQAAIELEMVANEHELERYDIPIVDHKGSWVLDVRAMVRAVVRDLAAAVPVSSVAARAHNGLANAASRCATVVAHQRGVTGVVLSGGVFQNTLLLERTAAHLSRSGLRVLIPERLPPNDGGLAYGQAAVVVARSVSRSSVDRGCPSGNGEK